MTKPAVAERLAAITAAIETDPANARSKPALASVVGCSIGQLDHVLNRYPEARALWDEARVRLAEERCRERKCSMCQTVKPWEEFAKDAGDPCGIGRRCYPCNRLSVKDHYQRNLRVGREG